MFRNQDARPSRRVLLVACVLVIAVVLGALWWVSGSDERRVSAACGTWLEHRDALRTAVSESDEAVERAAAADAESAVEDFNDLDTVRASVEQWLSESPRVIGSLDQGDDASELERGAVLSFIAVEAGLTSLQGMLEVGSPAEAATWLTEMAARFQGVDDLCLAAA